MMMVVVMIPTPPVMVVMMMVMVMVILGDLDARLRIGRRFVGHSFVHRFQHRRGVGDRLQKLAE
jgi:hypothetical protein